MEYWTEIESVKRFRRGLLSMDRSYYNEIVERYDVKTMLDVGCGFTDTRRVIERDLFYVGIDYTEQFLRTSTEKRVRGRAEQLPFPDRSFEMVTCRALIEHVQRPEPVIEEMIRVAISTIVIVWFLEPREGETLRFDRRGFWNNRHDIKRVQVALSGYDLVDRLEIDHPKRTGHVVWILRSY